MYSGSFSTGFVFYYWPYFKGLESRGIDGRHHGHSYAELFVSECYASFKEEVISSGFVSMKEWKKQIVLKGNYYYDTKKVKNIYCKTGRWDDNNHHGIKYKERISRHHLYAIIAYCDRSKLCTDFGATFRKNNEFEPLQLLKARNARYHHFSKLLVEIVQDFGINGRGRWEDGKWDDYGDGSEPGPFYCGLSFVMKVPQFAIYLNGPCSTSKDIEIAINFAKRDGIIIQLQNQNAGDHAQRIRFFDPSFISNYSEENERLFMCSKYQLKLQSIRIIETATNYEIFMHSLYILDAMISAVSNKDIKVKQSDIAILETLINGFGAATKEMDNYIMDTFQLYLNRKKEIKINICDFDASYYGDDEYRDGGCYKKLSHLIFHSVVNEGGYEEDGKWKDLAQRKVDNEDSNDLLNVLNTKILHKFPNLNKVEINTTFGTTLSDSFYPKYRFSLLSFLSSIEASKPSIKYVINAQRKLDDQWESVGVSWLYKIVSPSIKEAFNKKGWNITPKEEKYGNGKVKEDCLIFLKCFVSSQF